MFTGSTHCPPLLLPLFPNSQLVQRANETQSVCLPVMGISIDVFRTDSWQPLTRLQPLTASSPLPLPCTYSCVSHFGTFSCYQCRVEQRLRCPLSFFFFACCPLLIVGRLVDGSLSISLCLLFSSFLPLFLLLCISSSACRFRLVRLCI